MMISRASLLGALVLGLSLPAVASAKCRGKGEHPEIFVKPKTPLRRGPGLNYPVTAFLEKGRCLKLGEVSMDEAWVLVEASDVFGWVPAQRLSGADRKRVAAIKPSRAPVGSGQTRGVVWTNQSEALRETPQETAATVKLLPKGDQLIALAATGDGVWVQVRDERGDVGWIPATRIRDESGVLAGVPRTSQGVEVRTVTFVETEPGEGGPSRTILVPMQRGVLIDAQLLVGAMNPSHTLDSNGQAAYRRYEIRAVSAAARVEAQTSSLGPLHGRASYGLTLLTGLASEGQEGAIGGAIHEVRTVLGLPIELGPIWIAPELGYTFVNVDLEPILPGDPIESGGTFFSSRTHAGTAGVSLTWAASERIAFDLELAGLVGTTDEYPLDLGRPGLTVGGVAGLGVRLALGDSAALVGRWDARLRRARFDGPSVSDPSIGEATLSVFDQGLFAGAVFAL
jgi:uncharacterized protein YgiM (DUF1202 family)